MTRIPEPPRHPRRRLVLLSGLLPLLPAASRRAHAHSLSQSATSQSATSQSATSQSTASHAPVLDLSFTSMPSWRRGPMPWPPVAKPLDAPDFVLSASYMSGLRAPFRTDNGSDPAWASLSNEQEAYPDGDAIADLGLTPFSIQDGTLLLTASPIPPAAAATLPSDMPRRYLSGAFNTYPFSQTYGYFEITARIPTGRGLWPAFWLLPVDQSWPPEIDVFEVLGDDPAVSYSSIHTTDAAWAATEPGSYNGNTTTDKVTAAAPLSNAFHRYAVDWTASTITFYLDGMMVRSRSTPDDMHKPFYLVVDLAIGDTGSWPGPPDASTRFPASLAVRAIKVWHQNPHAGR